MSDTMNTVTLYELLNRAKSDEDYVNRITIPRVQRDYAQGRNNNKVKKIRHRFFSKLVKAISSDDSKPIVLDFVYGSLEHGEFFPLDGQQRLTTLFLLHWIAAAKEEEKEKEDRKEGEENFYEQQIPFLSRFTYLTRDSAKEFLTDLVKNFRSPDFSKPLSVQIEDAAWFPLSWKEDPTVAGMLVALDKLQQLFQEMHVVGAWHRLVNERKLSFHCKFISDMGVTDTIYIKMNSRGLPLTDFEHFKSEFESRLTKLTEQGKLEHNKLDGFKRNLDKDWTDMLWAYRNKYEDDDPKHYMDNAIDKGLMNLIKYYLDMLSYKKGYDIKDNLFDTLDEILKCENGEECVNSLYDILNAMSTYPDLTRLFDSHLIRSPFGYDKIYIPTNQNYGINFFVGCIQCYGEAQKFPYTAMLYLEAFVTYLLNKKTITDSEFHERLRIIRNLVVNTPYLHENDLPKLLPEVDDIIEKGYSKDMSSFNREQEAQEWAKWEWYVAPGRTDDERKALRHLENHDILRGNLGVLIRDGKTNNANHITIDMDEAFYKLFPNDGDLDTSKLALLSMGDYGYTADWRTFYGNMNRTSWYDDIFSSYKETVPTAIIRNTLSKLKDYSLKELADDARHRDTFDWRYYISTYGIIRNGPHNSKGVYHWQNRTQAPYKVLLMRTQKSLNGYHWNPFLLALQKEIEYVETTLDNWESPLRIPDKNDPGHWLSVTITNAHLNIKDDDNVTKGSFEIPMSNGIDTEDRIKWCANKLREEGFIPERKD